MIITSNFKDLTGMIVNDLTVIKREKDEFQSNGKRRTMWGCLCQHNHYVIARGDSLKTGKYVCPLCRKERQLQKSQEKKIKPTNQYNTYILSGEYGIGYTSKGDKFLFDLEDYELIKKYVWVKDKRYFYAKITGTNKRIALHRLIMGFPDEEVDHKNGRGSEFDNRKSNLRIATQIENCQNKSKLSNNTSGHKGVSWDKSKQKWVAQIGYHNKRITLGRFNNIEDAIECRNNAERKLFGEFANIEEDKERSDDYG